MSRRDVPRRIDDGIVVVASLQLEICTQHPLVAVPWTSNTPRCAQVGEADCKTDSTNHRCLLVRSRFCKPGVQYMNIYSKVVDASMFRSHGTERSRLHPSCFTSLQHLFEIHGHQQLEARPGTWKLLVIVEEFPKSADVPMSSTNCISFHE